MTTALNPLVDLPERPVRAVARDPAAPLFRTLPRNLPAPPWVQLSRRFDGLQPAQYRRRYCEHN